MAKISTTPPESVQNNCKRGLAMLEEGLGGDGLEPATIKEARSMARGEAQTENKIRKGYRWWARNERFLDEPSDSNAMVSALLWGGASGRDWFRKVYNQLTEEEKSEKMKLQTRQARQFELRAEDMTATQGGMKGMAMMYGRMDSYMTVFAPASATASLPDFVKNGSFLSGHEADDLPIGYVVSAIDNGLGVEVELEYHTTEEAMNARTVAMERLKAGKKVGLSLGFNIGNYVECENGEALLNMAMGMGMDLNNFDVEAIRKCNRECYLVTRIQKIYEVSQVNFPAIPQSEATSVRYSPSEDSQVAPAEPIAPAEPVAQPVQPITEPVTEPVPVQDEERSEPEQISTNVEPNADENRHSNNPSESTHVGLSLSDQIDIVLDAIEVVNQRASEVLELRQANDKTLGKATIEKLTEVRDELSALIYKAEAPARLERQQSKFARLKEIL